MSLICQQLERVAESGSATPPLPLASAAVVDVTILIPAYNEQDFIERTLRCIQAQTLLPARVLVVDDCSTDDTGPRALAAGAEVIRTGQNRGSKAGALNYALQFVETEFLLIVDADTSLAEDAVEKLLGPFWDPDVAGASGFIVPLRINTMWERGRYAEYLFAFSFFRNVQDFFGRPLVASGCFCAFRTDLVRKVGGWPHDTLAEDMDLTWQLYLLGKYVRFVPAAQCFPVEPPDFKFLKTQLTRWCHGFIQCVQKYGLKILQIPTLWLLVVVGFLDSVIGSIANLILVPLLAVFAHPAFLLLYIVDAPMMLTALIYQGIKRRDLWRSLSAYPCFLIVRQVNYWLILEAFVSEMLLANRLKTFVKGH
jgi:cellulose synthase/poly-beta-1,6-N-acetylglucosamine synthase-like glycosyltransferase